MRRGTGGQAAPQVPLCHGALVPKGNFKVAASGGTIILAYDLIVEEPTRALVPTFRFLALSQTPASESPKVSRLG